MNWKPVAVNSAYLVSDCGQVKRIATGRVRNPVSDKDGYLRVSMGIEGRMRIVSVHRLVASAFIANPLEKPCVNHIDGDKRNNRVSNLEWATDSENWNHAIRTGLSDPRTRSKLGPQARAEIPVLSKCGLGTCAIAARYGVKRGAIWRLLSGRTYRS